MAEDKNKKPKKVNVDLVEKADADGGLSEPYRILYDLLKNPEIEHHDLLELNFCLVWKFNIKFDSDEFFSHSVPKILTPIQRIRTGDDIEITINADWWNNPNTTTEQKYYCLDDALSQIRPQIDEDEEYVRDENGRMMLSKRKYTIQVFPEVEERYSEGTNTAMKKLSIVLAMRSRKGALRGDRYGLEDIPEDQLM